MPGSGTRTLTDPEDYQAALRQLQIDLVMLCCGEFKARLTWVELDHLYLLRCEEDHPRIGYVSLPRGLAVVAFRTDKGPPPLWAGTGLQLGDLVFHSPGERFHQRTTGPCTWHIIALTAADLEELGQTFLGMKLAAPAVRRVLRPAPPELIYLRRLHAAACRLAETRARTLAHREAARSLEDDLSLALVTCLASSTKPIETRAKQARIMAEFEEELVKHLRQPRPLRDLYGRLGITGKTLQACCAAFLGISPSQYIFRRKLREVRIALRDADPDAASVAQIANEWGFPEAGVRFAASYLAAFGETPSTTLRRPISSFSNRMLNRTS